jgi:hypothetical protein
MNGFLIVLGFCSCVHFLYTLPNQLWNDDALSNAFEIFCAQTRHIQGDFGVEFVNLSLLVCELWFFELGCDNLCHTIDVQLHDFNYHASWTQIGLNFCMNVLLDV